MGFGRVGRVTTVDRPLDFCVRDTLSATPAAHEDAEALRHLIWTPQTFDAHISPHSHNSDATVAFPSPLCDGDPTSDRVHLDWYHARDRAGAPVSGQAMLVLDILHGSNVVSSFIARTFARNGIHGLVMHMPHTALRTSRPAREKYDWGVFLPSLRQAVMDARRARDVIAQLPGVDGSIGVQGTSLGGFVTTLAAGLDGAFDKVVVALAGGDVFGILSAGSMDAAKVRHRLEDLGWDDDRLREELWKTEPLRLAHRLNAARTWLFSARWDQVVPSLYSARLARSIGLSASHHRKFAGCHYSCVLSAPRMLSEMLQVVRAPIAVAA